MSLRARLLLATGVAALCALLLVDVVTYVLLSRSQVQQIDDALTLAHRPIEELTMAGSPDALGAIAQIAPGTFVAVLDDRGQVIYSTPAVRAGDDPVAVSDEALRDVIGGGDSDGGDGSDRAGSRDGGGDRSLTVRADEGENDRIRLRVDPLDDGRTLITGQSLHGADEVRSRLLMVLVGATAAAMLAVAGIGWWLVRLGLRPLSQVEASAQRITDGDLADQRVPGANETTEVGQLASALNAMLDRLEVARDERETTLDELRESEARMRRFVADASHELRTPVAATSAYAELFDQGARSRPADLQRAMSGIQNETARMASLIDDLLALTRLDEEAPVELADVDMTDVVLEAVDAARVVAPDRPVQLKMPSIVMVRGDRIRLRQVVDNLLANVRSHTPPGTHCVVDLRTSETGPTLTVSDEGPGLSDEQLSHIFERFYRVDSARTRVAGGSGLGLSIVGAIVALHGGSISASHNEPVGLVITVQLPKTTGESLEAADPVIDAEIGV